MNGIILRSTKIRDNDLILEWLTDEDVILTAAANRVQGSRYFPNGLDALNVYEIELTRRREQTMYRLNAAYHQKRFERIIGSMTAYACAHAATEAVTDICPQDSAVMELFTVMLQTFAVMDTEPDYAPVALAWFEVFLLNRVGAMPNTEMCARCARHLNASVWFQQEVGFFCASCAENNENIESLVLNSIRKLNCQTLAQTMRNAMMHAPDDKQFRRTLPPLFRFLFAVLKDNSPVCRFKAHRFMSETVFQKDIYLAN